MNTPAESSSSAVTSRPRNETPPDADRPIAPIWHTLAVLAILLGFALASARSAAVLPARGSRSLLPTYLLVIVLEWALVAWIAAAARSRGVSFAELVGGNWRRVTAVLRDVGLAIAFLIVGGIVLQIVGHLLKVAPTAGMRNVIPRTGAETVVFLFVALTAGFCEELIFRGYFLRQFTAFTRSAAAGVVLQAIVFGVAHGYQGWKYVVMITAFGSLFGLLALWRRSLRPGMIAHFVQDGVGGLVARHLLR